MSHTTLVSLALFPQINRNLYNARKSVEEYTGNFRGIPGSKPTGCNVGKGGSIKAPYPNEHIEGMHPDVTYLKRISTAHYEQAGIVIPLSH